MAPDVLTYFRQKARSYSSPSTRDNYQKFVASLERFLDGAPLTFEEVTPQLTAAWRDSLVERGSSAAYINRLGQNFRSLTRAAAKEGLIAYDPASFAWVTSTRPEAAIIRKNDGSALELLQRVAAFTGHNHQPFVTAARLILVTVTTGLSLDTLSHAVQDDFDGETLMVADKPLFLPIIASVALAAMQPDVADPEAPLVPGLRGSMQHERIASLLSYLGRPVPQLLPKGGENGESGNRTSGEEKALLRKRVSDHLVNLTEKVMTELREAPASIHSFLPIIPEALKVKYPGPRPALSHYHRTEIGERLAKAIDDLTPYWYVINMSASDHDTVLQLLTDCSHPVEEGRTAERGVTASVATPTVETYYPMEALTKTVGNKIRHIESPVIRNIMFVRSDRRKIAEIAKRLYPAAYVMRSARTSAAPYARIQPRDFNRFRLIVSHGRDFEECDAQVRDLTPDTRVKITADLYAGYSGIVIRRRDANTYDISLLGTNFSLFAVSLPSQFLQPE